MHITRKEISEFIAKTAPILAAAISETNPIAGMVIELIARLFGANPLDDADIMSKMSSDPDVVTKLKQLELAHQDVLLNNQSEEYQAKVQGMMNAREREEIITKQTGKPDKILHILAFTIILGFFSLCALNYFVNMSNDHIIMMVIGQLSSSFNSVVAYYFWTAN